MGNDHMNLHSSVEVEIRGAKLFVDLGIVDLVEWLNELPGVETYTSCQGGAACCSPQAFVGFRCSNLESVARVRSFVQELGTVSNWKEDSFLLQFEDPQNLTRLNEKKFPDSDLWKSSGVT